MKIAVGSLNRIKIEAVQEVLAEYPDFADCEIISVEAPSDVSEQPKSLDETMRGAMNRAKHAWQEKSIAFGIEAGLMEVPRARGGYMHVNVCAIYDGSEHFYGISSAWECPADIMKMMLEEGLTLEDAFYKSGWTDDPKIGRSLGAIGLLTEGRIDRKAYTKQAIQMAVIHLKKSCQ